MVAIADHWSFAGRCAPVPASQRWEMHELGRARLTPRSLSCCPPRPKEPFERPRPCCLARRVRYMVSRQELSSTLSPHCQTNE